MFRVFGNAWRIPDLKKKILFTIMVLVLYRLGSAIPVPFVDGAALATKMADSTGGTIVGYFNMLSGYAFQQGTLFALGVSPYITSSIVMQLLTIAIPALERMSKNGPEGQAKIQRITRWVTVILAVITAYGYFITIKGLGILATADWFAGLVIVVTLTAGSSIVMWVGERIDDKGIGNGISMILFANIVSSAKQMFASMWQLIDQSASQIFWVILAMLVMLLIITLTVFFSNSERRLNVQYAKRQVGRKMYGGMNTHLPIKVLMSGVMPIIFANAIVMMPATLAMFFDGWKDGVETWFSANSSYPFYVIVMFILIVAFAYFYLSISFNTVEVANNLKKNGGTILGYRPGKPTADYIKKVVNRVTLMGSVFLSFMAIFPVLLSWTGSDALRYLVFGGTSIIIVVSVALETTRQLESEITMRHYKGFLD